MRTALRILIALAIATSLIIAGFSIVAPQVLPIVLAVLGGAVAGHAIAIGLLAFWESASPATKAQRRLAREVEQAVERRKLQQANASESRSSTAGGTT